MLKLTGFCGEVQRGAREMDKLESKVVSIVGGETCTGILTLVVTFCDGGAKASVVQWLGCLPSEERIGVRIPALA